MSKEFIVEVRIKYDELMDTDQLQMLSLFTDRSTSAIKRKLVDEVVQEYLKELPKMEIDLSDLRERVKQGIVDRKVDEVLEND